MKITFRIALRQDTRAALAQDPALASALDLSALVLLLDSDDPRFQRLLEVSRHTSGAWLNPVMRFSAAEMAQARFFQLECRGKIVRETPRDNELNRARIDELGFHAGAGRPLRIKLIDRVVLSKVVLPAGTVGCATDWMSEFVIPASIAEVFEQEQLGGFERRPLLDAGTGLPHAEYFLLYSESIMPDATRDATTVEQTDASGVCGWRELGCLTYALSGSATPSDFNRTAEDWSNSHMPIWVVSERVREVFQRQRLKGWAFRPVLELGTPLHRVYTELWSDVMARVAINSNNMF